MEVNIKQALKMFFSKSSFEMIYFEAFANALDANATEFNINISLSNYGELHNLIVILSDNGVGFNDVRFGKFSQIYLMLKNKATKVQDAWSIYAILIKLKLKSVFDNSKQRVFEFNEAFDKDCTITEIEPTLNGSIFRMSGFTGERLGKNDYINPHYIKKALLENFYMKFYKAKLAGKQISVYIKTTIGGSCVEDTINTVELPNFQIKPLGAQTDLFNKIELYYNVREVAPKDSNVITALAIDERSHKIDIIAGENLPTGYEMIFLLMSESFQGSVDGARINLSIPDSDLSIIKFIFRNAIAEVVKEQFPQIERNNKSKEKYLNDTYPHLSG